MKRSTAKKITEVVFVVAFILAVLGLAGLTGVEREATFFPYLWKPICFIIVGNAVMFAAYKIMIKMEDSEENEKSK